MASWPRRGTDSSGSEVSNLRRREISMSKNSVEPKVPSVKSSSLRLTNRDSGHDPADNSGDANSTPPPTADTSTKGQGKDEHLTSLATLWRLNIAMTSPSSNQAIRAALIIRRLERHATSETRRMWRYETVITSTPTFGSCSVNRKPRPRYKGNIGDYGRCSFWDISMLTR